MNILMVTAAALIDGSGREGGGRVLLTQRPADKHMGDLWEFPGGKITDGETPEAALCRELMEELAILVEPKDLVPLSFASYPYPDFHLLMPLFACWDWSGKPVAAEDQPIAWVDANELGKRPMPPADEPLVAAVRALL